MRVKVVSPGVGAAFDQMNGQSIARIELLMQKVLTRAFSLSLFSHGHAECCSVQPPFGPLYSTQLQLLDDARIRKTLILFTPHTLLLILLLSLPLSLSLSVSFCSLYFSTSLTHDACCITPSHSLSHERCSSVVLFRFPLLSRSRVLTKYFVSFLHHLT